MLWRGVGVAVGGDASLMLWRGVGVAVGVGA